MSAQSQRGGALELRNVSKSFGRTRAIDDVSLDIPPGEFISLLGPSGSGKSTILMAIAGFIKPDRGDIRLDGRPMLGLTPERRAFGVVFQGYALFPHMTVAGNVEYPLKLRGVPRETRRARLMDALDQVRLAELADRYPRQLSGGQQQRVALARALVFEPPVILLDEPLSALDKKLRGDLQLELKALHDRLGTTFVNVTHDQEEAMNMSDRIVILNEGRILQSGPPEILYNAPASRFVADFLGRANFLYGEIGTASDGQIAVSRGDVTLKAPMPVGGNPDSKATLAIRPERIAVRAADSACDAENAVAGRVISAIFNGAHLIYRVDTVFGEIMAITSSFHSERRLSRGDAATLSWQSDAGVVLPIDMS